MPVIAPAPKVPVVTKFSLPKPIAPEESVKLPAANVAVPALTVLSFSNTESIVTPEAAVVSVIVLTVKASPAVIITPVPAEAFPAARVVAQVSTAVGVNLTRASTTAAPVPAPSR